MIKQKTKISVFLLMTIIFVSLILTNVPVTPKIRSVKNDNDRLNQISAPKLSYAPVVEKWNYQSSAATVGKVAISFDGEYTALTTDFNVTLFNKLSNIPMWTYTPIYSGLNSLGMSGNGTYILASGNQYVYLLNNSIESPKTLVWTYELTSAIAATSSISESGEDVIFVETYNIRFFNNTYSSGTKAYEWILTHPDLAIWNSVKISTDGTHIVYGSSNDCVYFFNTSAPTTYEIKFNTSADVNFVDISKDGKYIVAGNTDNEVYLLNTTDYQGKAMWNYTCPSGYNLAEVGISTQGNRIIVGYNEISTQTGTLSQFDNTYFTGNKVPMWSYVYGTGESISSIDISSDESYIVVGYFKISTGLPCVVLLNTTITIPKAEIWKGIQYSGANAKSVAISRDGTYFVSLESSFRTIYFFYRNEQQTSPNQLQRRWEYENINAIKDLDISKTGQYVAAAISKNITLFDKYSNATIWSFESKGSNDMSEIEISYNGTYIIGCNGSLGSGNSKVFLLNNTASGAPWNPLEMWKYPSDMSSSYGFYVDMSDNGQKIVAADSFSAWVYLFNNSFSSEKQPEKIVNTAGLVPTDVAISWDGYYFVMAAFNSIYLFNTSNPSTYEWSFDTTQTVKEVAIGYDILKDIYYITAYNQDNEVYLLNHTYEDPKIAMWNFSITTGTVNDIEISDNGKYIVVGENSGYVYVLNNTFSTDKKPEWNNKRFLDREVKSVDISSNGSYIVAGYSTTYDPDWGLVQLFNTSAADPDEPIWWDLTKSVSLVAISGLGDHIAVVTPNPHIYLYYRYVYIPPVIYILIGDDDGGGDEEEAPVVVPFGNYYLIFVVISVISLIVLKKRKVILKEK